MIRFDCRHCGKELEVDSRDAGERIECDFCRELVRVPEQSEYRAPRKKRKLGNGAIAAIVAGVLGIFLATAIVIAFAGGKKEPEKPAEPAANARCPACLNRFYLEYKPGRAEWVAKTACPVCGTVVDYGTFHWAHGNKL
jgi:DNA-directed RNA polymerase subunit M/transcription elongation factor TFIIS